MPQGFSLVFQPSFLLFNATHVLQSSLMSVHPDPTATPHLTKAPSIETSHSPYSRDDRGRRIGKLQLPQLHRLARLPLDLCSSTSLCQHRPCKNTHTQPSCLPQLASQRSPHTRPTHRTVGGGGLANGSFPSYTGWPAYPFNSSNRFFRTRQAGNIAFALVNNAPVNITNDQMSLYFDWYVGGCGFCRACTSVW